MITSEASRSYHDEAAINIASLSITTPGSRWTKFVYRFDPTTFDALSEGSVYA